jgi:hypothetical protein
MALRILRRLPSPVSRLPSPVSRLPSMGDDAVIVRGVSPNAVAPEVAESQPDVLAAQEGTVEVLHTLRPLIVVMAGENESDPYKH